MGKKKYIVILITIALLPLWMWLVWLLSPNSKFVVAIIDKTVLTTDGQEHVSLNWMLNYKKLCKTSTKSYAIDKDYYGFFPLANEKFKLKGLERFSPSDITQLSKDADAVYSADTYGIYKNEWYSQKANTERSGILYGGMSTQDMDLLQNMKQNHKLIIAEFNTIASPTKTDIRNRFEKTFAMKWSGWIARYFDSFDTTSNKELPKWLINNYLVNNNNKWPFKKGGMAFVSNNDQVVILEDGTHLTKPVPEIITGTYGQQRFSLPERIKYSFWFDVIIPNLDVNHAVSRFDFHLNPEGAKELSKYGIPQTCPAVLMHNANDYQFYYFSGDFCDNPISTYTSYFKGIPFFKWIFYNSADPAERKSFFWDFYRPMMSEILDDRMRRSKQH